MDVQDAKQRDRLFRAVKASYKALEPFRNLNRGLVEEYAGAGYGRLAGEKRETVLNLMNQAVDAYVMSLVANRPRIIVSTPHQELTFFGKRYEIAINNLIQEIGLEYTLREWVLNAFFSVGIIKVHMADAGAMEFEQDVWIDPGTPFASVIALDDFVFDMSAKRWGMVQYAGDVYRIPYDMLRSGVYDEAVVDQLGIQPSTKYGGDEQRLERISRGQELDSDEVEPMVDLCDLWLPSTQQIATFWVTDRNVMDLSGPPLGVMDWTGTEQGPYNLLGFNDVPDNIMPTSPASHLAPLSRQVNNIARKQSRRAKNSKRVHTYTPQTKDDAKRIRDSADDDWVATQDPNSIGEVVVGGIDPGMQAFMHSLIDQHDRMAGNLVAIMGLGAQADTASQEQLIHTASSKKIASMMLRVLDGSTRVIRSLGHLLWQDEFKTLPGTMRIPGAESYVVDMTWSPERRDGQFQDYNFNIDLYSMAYRSPTERMQTLQGLFTQIILPLQPMIEQQGGMVDVSKFLELMADLNSEPRIGELVKWSEAPPDNGIGPTDTVVPKPTNTTRNYVRRNVPTGGTAASRSQIQQQAWMGMANNQAQADSMTRAPA